MYLVSCIIQDGPGGTAWLCPCSEPCSTEQEARVRADGYKSKFRCLSVWIDCSGPDGTRTVWHEALVDALGRVAGWDK